LIIDGIAEALKNTKAKCIYVANLVTKRGQTTGFTVSDLASEIEKFVGAPFLDYVLYNKQLPNKTIANKYKKEGAYSVKVDKSKLNKATYQAIAGDFLGKIIKKQKSDAVSSVRSLIRHDSASLAKAIIDIYSNIDSI
jgi:uncharacterized cofD-like protein